MCYWDAIKGSFQEVADIMNSSPEELYALVERSREQLSEMLGEEGTLLLEQYTLCIELLCKGNELLDSKKRRL